MRLCVVAGLFASAPSAERLPRRPSVAGHDTLSYLSHGLIEGYYLVALLAGLFLIYAGGMSWLAVQSGWAAAVSLGLFPFVAADLVKAVMALVVGARLRDRCRALFSI